MDETLKYKVQLDTSDLAEQLRQVREQIDTSIGAVLGGGQQPDFGAPAASNFSNPLEGVKDAFAQAGQSVSNVLSQAELGYNKFREDIAKTGILTPGIPDFQLTPGYRQHDLPTNVPSAIGGIFGFGYDINNTMTRGSYKEFSAKTFAEGVGKFAATSIFSTIGMAGGFGAWGGAFGGLVGLGVGMAADITAEHFAKDYIERDTLAKEFSMMAGQGGLRRDASAFNSIALETIRAPREWNNRALGYTKEMMQTNIESFADAGGFSGAGSVDEFTDRVQKVIANTDKIAKQLGVFQEEAARIMGELEGKQVASLGNMNQFAARMQSMGGLAGMTGSELISAGLQGMQNVAGTGLGPAAGFELATQSLLEANMMARGDSASRNAIFDAGGVERATQLRMQTAMQYTQSTPGMIEALNLLGGGVYSPGDMQGAMFGANLAVSQDPTNLLKATGSAGLILGKGMTPQQIQTASVDNAVGMMQRSGMTDDSGKVNSLALKGYLMQVNGMSAPEAELATRSYSSGGGVEYGAKVESIYNGLQTNLEMQPGAISKILSAPGALLSALFKPIGDVFGMGYEGVSGFTTDVFEDIGDHFTGSDRIRFPKMKDDAQRMRVLELIKSAGSRMGELPSYEDYTYKSDPAGRNALDSGKTGNLGIPEGYSQETFKANVYVAKNLLGDIDEKKYTEAIDLAYANPVNWDTFKNQTFADNKELYDKISNEIYGSSFDALSNEKQRVVDENRKLHFGDRSDATKDTFVSRYLKDKIQGTNVLKDEEKLLNKNIKLAQKEINNRENRMAMQRATASTLEGKDLDVSGALISTIQTIVTAGVTRGDSKEEILNSIKFQQEAAFDDPEFQNAGDVVLNDITESTLTEIDKVIVGKEKLPYTEAIQRSDDYKKSGALAKATDAYLEEVGFNDMDFENDKDGKKKESARKALITAYYNKRSETDWVHKSMSIEGRAAIAGVNEGSLDSISDMTTVFLEKDEQARQVTIDTLHKGNSADRDAGNILESLQNDPAKETAMHLRTLVSAISTDGEAPALRIAKTHGWFGQ